MASVYKAVTKPPAVHVLVEFPGFDWPPPSPRPAPRAGSCQRGISDIIAAIKLYISIDTHSRTYGEVVVLSELSVFEKILKLKQNEETFKARAVLVRAGPACAPAMLIGAPSDLLLTA